MNKVSYNTNKLYFTEPLTESLNAIIKFPLTIVEAPMGYGKTVAVREFLRGQNATVLWVPFTSDGKSSYREICFTLIEEYLPELRETVARLRLIGSLDDDYSVSQFAAIIQELCFPIPMVIVLDDYQYINNMQSSRLIEQIAKRRIENLHIVLLTRDTYCGNAEILGLKGLLTVIGRDRFILRKHDIIAYYGSCGVSLEEGEAEFLFSKTEGWISALYLYLLRYSVEGLIAFPINIYELIDREMFSWFSDELKEFLYAVSPFHSFTFEQADFVWAGDNTHDLITELRFKNTFVTYNDITRRFYIHSIFQQFLERVVARLKEEARYACYERCGDWFLQEKEYFQAIRYYEAADQFDGVMKAIEADQGRCISAQEWQFFSGIMDRCPEQIKTEHTSAMLFMAIHAFLVDDREAFERCLGTICKAAEALSTEDPQWKFLNGMIDFIQAFREFNQISLMKQKFLEAAQTAQGMMKILAEQDSVWTVGAPSLLLLFHRDSGRLEEEIVQMEELLEVYGSIAGRRDAGIIELMEAEKFYFQGKEAQARIKAYAAEVLIAGSGETSNLFYVKFLQLRLALLAGDKADVNGRLEEMDQMAQNSRNQGVSMRQMMELHRSYYHGYMGRGKQISSWIRSGNGMSHNLTLFAYPSYQIIYGKSLLLEGSYEKIIGVFEVLLSQELYTRHMLFVIYAEIYLAAAQYAMGWESQALGTLKYGLDMALTDGMILPFAENCRELAPLMEVAVMMECYRPAVRSIRRLAKRLEEGRERLAGAGRQKRSELLTMREQQMAQLASGGRTNSEIAAELCLAQSTVKRAMVTIFRKLEIHNREELIEQKQWFENRESV